MEELALDREKPVKMQIYEWLRDQIISGKLTPGSILDKNGLSHQLGVSPTPLREALILLKHDKFIDVIPNLHTVVKLIKIELVSENAFIRSALEGAVAEQLAITGISKAVEKNCRCLISQQICAFDNKDYDMVFHFDLQIHKTLCDVLNHDSLWENLYANRAHLDRARQCSPINIPGIKRAIEQHEKLLDYITRGKPDEARKLMKDHVYSVFDDLKKIDPKFMG